MLLSAGIAAGDGKSAQKLKEVAQSSLKALYWLKQTMLLKMLTSMSTMRLLNQRKKASRAHNLKKVSNVVYIIVYL